MTTLVYDGSFNGLLTAVFEVYEYKFQLAVLVREEQYQPAVFTTNHMVITDEEKAERVWKGLQLKLTAGGVGDVYKVFLSGQTTAEKHLFNYLLGVFGKRKLKESDLADADVLAVKQMARKVDREKHRMEAFIRFELTKDQLYYAVIQPDYNVLPLISKHFKQRYADQRWLIYDSRRKYGLFYDLSAVTEVQINFNDGLVAENMYDEKEQLYQQLWKCYFENVNIPARKNLKLHIQHMPKRYWRFLTEKKIAI